MPTANQHTIHPVTQVLTRDVLPCRTCLLNDPTQAWLVQAGRADVFSVRVEDGVPVGNRKHLFRVAAGQLLFGIAQPPDTDVALYAVGSFDTEIVEVNLEELYALGHAPEHTETVGTLVETWIEHLSSGISIGVTPKENTELAPGTEMEVPPGTNVIAQRGVSWVSHVEGQSRLMGNEALPQINGTGFFPLAHETWLETEEPCTLLGHTTHGVMQADALWEGLDQIHAVVFECVRLIEDQAEAENRARLQRKAEADRQALAQAVSNLTGVLMPEAPPVAVEHDHDNLLLTACRLVGERQGITITEPPKRDDQESRQDRLGDIARASRIRTRRVVLADDWWRHDNGPMLGLIEEGRRPVALLPPKPGYYELYDPATGTVQPVDEEINEGLSPFAFTFFRPFPEDKITLRRLLAFGLQDCKKDLVTMLVMGVLIALLGLLSPIATGMIFNTFIPGAQRSQLLQLTAILIVSALAIGFFGLARSLAILRINGKLGTNVQTALWDRLLRLPVSFFKDYTAGDLAMRAMGISQIQRLMSGVVITTILAALFSVFDITLLFVYSPPLALWAILLVGIAVAITFGLTYSQLRFQRAISALRTRLSGLVLQFLTGISKLRVAGAEAKAFKQWAEHFSKQRSLQYKAHVTGNWTIIFNNVFPVAASMLIYYQALMQVTEGGSLLTGDFLAFNAAFTKFLFAMVATNGALQAILVSIPVYENARPILETLPEVNLSKANPGVLRGEIEMQHVAFRYTPDGPLILKEVSMHIEPGAFVAFVGTSGSGKSTTLRLLLGFETPESGSIFYDGQDLAGLDIQEVRRQIGVVLQDGKLLPGDIFTNIIGSSLATIDDAWAAARMAGFDEDIKQMPMGMHTVISAGGSTLSGGQRQRLMIARALVNKPRILFFDEATSALDNRTQAIVSESLERLQATRIVIAHRLSTIINADHIFVMDAGYVVEQGSYDELMALDGIFAELAKRQIA